MFTGTQRDAPSGIPWFSFHKADRRVTCYYFYPRSAADGLIWTHAAVSSQLSVSR